MPDFAVFARRLAEASAAVIKQHFRTTLNIETKADSSPVTLADKNAEAIMRQMIQREFPDHGIIGEEYGNHLPDAEYQWTLDPIDGTKNFVAGSVLFGTLIGLLKDGAPILGVIHQPITDQFLMGFDGETYLNGNRVCVRSCERIEDALLLCTTHWGVARHCNMAAYESLTRRARTYRTWGDCHGYYLVATGFADVMLDPIMNLWDVAPLVPIIEGAGGTITDWHGNPAIGGQGTVATGGHIHQAVIDMLNAGS